MKRNRSGDPPKTAAELVAELSNNPEYVADRERKSVERRQALNHSLSNGAGLLAELVSAGFHVETVADLFNRKMDYKLAIPILLSWLPKISDSNLKEDVVRALTVSWAKPSAAYPLVQELRQAVDSRSEQLKWTIANALSVVADDSVFDDIVQLVQDNRYGKSREMLALALGNMANPQAVKILSALLPDEQIVGHVVMALGTLGADDARSAIEQLASHSKPWIRKEVQSALAKIRLNVRGTK